MPIAIGSKAPDFSLKSKQASGVVDVSGEAQYALHLNPCAARQ